jgi:hypothetical protein
MEPRSQFEVVSVGDHVVHAAMRGFWSDSNIETLGREFLARFGLAVDRAASEGPFVVLADLSELEVLTPRGREYLAQAMTYAQERGLIKAVEVIPNAITALSVTEAAELSGHMGFRVIVRTLDEAWPLVESLKQEMVEAASTHENG